MTTEYRIRARCAEIAEFLVAKNQSYGDSALHPVGIFASGDAEALIRARLDDKLSRIRNAPDAFDEDVLMDLAGYVVLLLIVRDTKREVRSRACKGSARKG